MFNFYLNITTSYTPPRQKCETSEKGEEVFLLLLWFSSIRHLDVLRDS